MVKDNRIAMICFAMAGLAIVSSYYTDDVICLIFSLFLTGAWMRLGLFFLVDSQLLWHFTRSLLNYVNKLETKLLK